MIDGKEIPEQRQPERKAYNSPEIIHELQLETRAGSPLGMPDVFDLPHD